jgi:hypothetical protein
MTDLGQVLIRPLTSGNETGPHLLIGHRAMHVSFRLILFPCRKMQGPDLMSDNRTRPVTAFIRTLKIKCAEKLRPSKLCYKIAQYANDSPRSLRSSRVWMMQETWSREGSPYGKALWHMVRSLGSYLRQQIRSCGTVGICRIRSSSWCNSVCCLSVRSLGICGGQ